VCWRVACLPCCLVACLVVSLFPFWRLEDFVGALKRNLNWQLERGRLPSSVSRTEFVHFDYVPCATVPNVPTCITCSLSNHPSHQPLNQSKKASARPRPTHPRQLTHYPAQLSPPNAPSNPVVVYSHYLRQVCVCLCRVWWAWLLLLLSLEVATRIAALRLK
jgi:hypothetical protein